VVSVIELWLVRHGATDWSDAGRLNGWSDVPLNVRGRAQADALRTRVAGIDFAGIWSSDLGRAVATAEAMAVEPTRLPALRELDFGDLEGAGWAELDPDVQAALIEFDGFEAPRGGSVASLREGLHAFTRGLEGGRHLVVTHGGPIRALLRDAGADRQVVPGELLVLQLPGGAGILRPA
jgi:probable phosphoglycerate mutase